MAIVSQNSYMDELKRLADLLAPGRKVRSIHLDFSVNALATAYVEVLLEEKDLPTILDIAETMQPDQVHIIERGSERDESQPSTGVPGVR